MTIALPGAPFDITYRELWLPPGINNHATLPTSVEGGHELALTGAQKRTTADGVHFTGAANSNIIVAANAIQNGQQALAITIRFKLDVTYAAGAASNFYLFQKLLVNEWLMVYLNAADGLLRWEQGNGAGATGFQLTSTTNSWAAGVWHIATLSLTSTPTQRLLVDGVVEDTDTAAVRVTPGGGDMIIGNSVAAGVDGIIGVISWVVIGVGTTAATTLTSDEEQDLSKGIPPPTAKVQYMYLLDEGRGVISYDRGNAGGNGTIGAVCTWAFGQVEQPILSLDAINDHGQSSAGVDISGDTTMVWVGKMKSTYDGLVGNHYFIRILIDGVNQLVFWYYSTTNEIRFNTSSSGISVIITYDGKPAIDDYYILIGTLKAGGAVNLFLNGVLIGTNTSAGFPSVAAATAYIGSDETFTYYDISKPLMVALIDGAFDQKQALAYSRYIKNIFNLPISI